VPTGRERVDLRAARNTARHLVEGWAVEAAKQRKVATAYRDHLVALGDELRALQRANGVPEHECETCRQAAESLAAGEDASRTPAADDWRR
jgi:hypothetical protein